MPRYERILPLLGVILMGLGLILLVERINTLTFAVPLPAGFEARVSIAWLVLFFLLVVMAIGAEAVRQEAGESTLAPPATRRLHLHPACWTMPVLVTLSSFLFLRLLSGVLVRSLGLAVTGFLLLAVLIAQHYEQDERPGARNASRLVLEIAVYLDAFFLYGAIYTVKVRSLLSATSIVVLTFLLAFELLRRLEPRRQVRIYAALLGLCVGEVTWPLNYWPIGGLLGGAFLLVGFYVLVNLVRDELSGSLSPRAILAYVLLGLLSMGAIGASMFWPH